MDPGGWSHGVRTCGLLLAVLLAGCSGGLPQRKAEPAPALSASALLGGGPLDYLTADAQDALVHLRVLVQGEARPRPGTAFVVGRSGGKVFLLTAWHVLHPLEGRATVARVELRGRGVKPRWTEHPGGAPVPAGRGAQGPRRHRAAEAAGALRAAVPARAARSWKSAASSQ
jgi:hypothetical protein